MKKLKFKPQIARVKLNPEQAVLQCNCYTLETRLSSRTSVWDVNENDMTSACVGKTISSDIRVCLDIAYQDGTYQFVSDTESFLPSS